MTSPLSNSTSFRKVFQGVATRRQMHRMFDRHAQRPHRRADDGPLLYAGEWFEIGAAEHDQMLEILPPLWMRVDMFAMREFLTGSVTSVFFTLSIDRCIRYFHGYCDLSVPGSPAAMQAVIAERETGPARVMTRGERLEHIWSATHDDYRGYARERWSEADRGKRTVLIYEARTGSTCLKFLEALTTREIAAKLPVQLRHAPERAAA